MLEIGGAPVMERLVRRMEVGGCKEIRVVTRPAKTDIRLYAERRGLSVVLGQPAHIGESIAAGLDGLDRDDVIALGFPDSLWEPLDGYAILRAALDDRSDVVLGLFRFDDPRRADVVELDAEGRPRSILVKPENPPSNTIWGCLVARRSVLEGIRDREWPTEHLVPLIDSGRVAARYLSDSYVDIGIPETLARVRESGWPADGGA
jgi:NDP-sugar pyrophosphorylase family protein